MAMNETICLILVIIAGLLILTGAWMTYRRSRDRQIPGETPVEPESLHEDINALTKLIEAIRGLPPGQWMIVLGIVILIIALTFCGLSGLTGRGHA
jgi:uncharacterized membrane protein YhaH (DUF805 family)